MKCVCCDKETNEFGLKVTLDGLKQLHLIFCAECVNRVDIFVYSIPLTVITDQNTAMLKLPAPPFAEMFYQYLAVARTKMSYNQFVRLPCTCCHREDIKIVLESVVRGAAVLLVFCGRCAVKPNIFLDHTPLAVSNDHPTAALFVTPNFDHYLYREDKTVTWDRFKK